MGKALYGFHGGPDPRTEAELAMLRKRVRELEAELDALRRAESVDLADEELGLSLLTPRDGALV